MFYKHWKKIALALTGFFWASCDDSASSAVCLYGPDPNYSSPTENPVSSSSETTEESSSSSTEVQKQSSSSEDFGKIVPLYGIEYEKFVSSSSTEESSSSFTEIMPAYGVPDKIACIEDPAGKKNDGSTVLMCDDGVTCQEKMSERWVPEYNCVEDICPDYGVVQISENTYECDGVKYNEAQFRARYEKRTVVEDPEQDTTMHPALYGSPCVFDGNCDDN